MNKKLYCHGIGSSGTAISSRTSRCSMTGMYLLLTLNVAWFDKHGLLSNVRIIGSKVARTKQEHVNPVHTADGEAGAGETDSHAGSHAGSSPHRKRPYKPRLTRGSWTPYDAFFAVNCLIRTGRTVDSTRRVFDQTAATFKDWTFSVLWLWALCSSRTSLSQRHFPRSGSATARSTHTTTSRKGSFS